MESYLYKLEGPILEENIPIHIAIDSLYNFQSILDKTYLGLKGDKQRLSKKERQYFQLRAQKFERGSLLTYFEIFLATTQLTLPFFTSLGPQSIWDYTKDSFTFLKLIYGAAQIGEQPTYTFHDNKDFTVHIGDTHNHFHGPVYQIGENALNNYRNLAHLTEEGISLISAGTTEQEDIKLVEKDKNLFDLPSEIEKDPIELKCEIFDFNKFNNKGRLLVAEGQNLPQGEYKFSIYGDQDNVDYIYSMLRPQVTITCLKESRLNPFAGEAVFRLHITGVTD